jgi:hypothetical protein
VVHKPMGLMLRLKRTIAEKGVLRMISPSYLSLQMVYPGVFDACEEPSLHNLSKVCKMFKQFIYGTHTCSERLNRYFLFRFLKDINVKLIKIILKTKLYLKSIKVKKE